MFRSSLPLGRLMGVDVRLHISFPVLLILAAVYGQAMVNNSLRGMGVWAALFFAVVVREVARSLAAAYLGLRLRALFLLPMGGVMAFAPEPGGLQPEDAALRPLMLSAPIANFGVGLLLLGASYACAPGVQLLAQPWISAGHVLRSFVWMQFVVCVLNLLPTAALPTRQMLRVAGKAGTKTEAPTARSAGPAFGLLTGLAMALMLAGMVTTNIWLIAMGAFTLLFSQLQKPQTMDAAGSDGMRVEEVMLTECVMLSSSDTLRGALQNTVHSLQDVFPVLRGDKLVGAVSRQTLANQLQTEGDGYLQGSMTRGMHMAEPKESLVMALQRAAALGASEFIPVVENGRLLGILTPQSLARAVQQVKMTRLPPREAKEPRP